MTANGFNDVFYGNRLHLNANQRRVNRFTLKHQHLWSVKLNGRKVPIEYVQDINWSGACLRIKDAGIVQSNQLVRLEVFYQNKIFFDVCGQIRWTKEASSYLKLFHMGIEFIDPDERLQKLWKEKKIDELTERTARDTISPEPSFISQKMDDLNEFLVEKEHLLLRGGQALLALGLLMVLFYITRL